MVYIGQVTTMLVALVLPGCQPASLSENVQRTGLYSYKHGAASPGSARSAVADYSDRTGDTMPVMSTAVATSDGDAVDFKRPRFSQFRGAAARLEPQTTALENTLQLPDILLPGHHRNSQPESIRRRWSKEARDVTGDRSGGSVGMWSPADNPAVNHVTGDDVTGDRSGGSVGMWSPADNPAVNHVTGDDVTGDRSGGSVGMWSPADNPAVNHVTGDVVTTIGGANRTQEMLRSPRIGDLDYKSQSSLAFIGKAFSDKHSFGVSNSPNYRKTDVSQKLSQFLAKHDEGNVDTSSQCSSSSRSGPNSTSAAPRSGCAHISRATPSASQSRHPSASEPRSACDCSAFTLLGLATSGAALAALGASLVQQLTTSGAGRSHQTPLAGLLPVRLQAALRDALPAEERLLAATCRAARQLASSGQRHSGQQRRQQRSSVFWRQEPAMSQGRESVADREQNSSPAGLGTGRNVVVQCQCYGGLLGSLTGFTALAGAVAFALSTTTTATTTTTTTAAPGRRRRLGRAASPPDWKQLMVLPLGLPNESLYDGGDICAARLLCSGFQEADSIHRTHGLYARLVSLPASWLLAFLGSPDQQTSLAQFDLYCQALVTSSDSAKRSSCSSRRLCMP